MPSDLSRIPVLRAARAIGWTGLLRMTSLVFLGLALGICLFLWRPDLTRPADIGTDASNYYAAGLRLIDGGPLYALSAGDRPVPADNPPLWSVPLLSPPPIAVLWAALALLPGALAMYGWWLGGLLGAMGTALHGCRSRTGPTLVAIILLSPMIAITAISGNVNAWLIPTYAMTFALTGSPASRRSTVALGVIAGSAAAFKLAPVLLVWWLLIQGRRSATVVAVATGLIWVAASIVVAGPGAFSTYVQISRATTQGGVSLLSATGIARAIGAPDAIATLAPLACLGIAAFGAFLLRRRPALASIALVLGTIFATPVVRFESFGLLVAAVVWKAPTSPPAWSRIRHGRRTAALVGALTVAAVLAWVSTVPQSSVLIDNRTAIPVVVRFGAAAQGNATFGFRVEAHRSARAFATLPGGLTGSLIVFGPGCRELYRDQAPSEGGKVTLDAIHGVAVAVDSGSPAAAAPYVTDCEGR